jgi:hypothetical protein
MTDFVFGIFGIISGLFCAFSDILFDLKGKNNVKSGPAKIFDSNLQIMSEWRLTCLFVLPQLQLINKRFFNDLPAIIMPSVGIAMIGLMTALTAIIAS